MNMGTTDWGHGGQSGQEQPSTGIAFILWLSCLFGVCGVHRFYLGRPVTGLLYVITFGFLGIGQLLDLFWMRDMVQRANRKRLLSGGPPPRLLPAPPPGRARTDSAPDLRKALLRSAAAHGGQITVAQGVMATGASFDVVEKTLDEMARSSHVGIDNHPDTGAVVYDFGRL